MLEVKGTAKVKLQNQEFDIPEELIALDPKIVTEKGEEEAKKQRDINLKRWLSQVSPAATNATLNWSEESKPDGSKQTVVRVSPQLGTKGGIVTEMLIESLNAIPQHVHPLIGLTFELKLRQINGYFAGEHALARLVAYQERINKALEHESGDGRYIQPVVRRLEEAKAVPFSGRL